MRGIVRTFVAEGAENLPISAPVVEIGSRPAEGQEAATNVRGLFGGVEYIGCDVQAGPNVDRIEDVHHLSFDDASVGTVVSLDTLEHVADPIRALEEIHRVLRPGGVVLITSVMFFPVHAHPWDFWRFTPEGFARLLAPFESHLVMAQGWEHMPETVLGVGVKGPYPLSAVRLFPETSKLCRDWGSGKPVDFGPMRLGIGELWGHTLRQTGAALLRRAKGRRAKGRRANAARRDVELSQGT